MGSENLKIWHNPIFKMTKFKCNFKSKPLVCALISALLFPLSACVSQNAAPQASPVQALEQKKPEASKEFKDKQNEMALEIEKYPLGIIGEVETVRLPEFNSSFEARIDTGATTCSIDAKDIKNFERDGRKWVSFKIKSRTSDEEKSFELPVVRIVPIRRHGMPDQQRFSVMLNIKIGHLTLEREFTLTDRSAFDYPVLIGRNLLSGIAVVDVTRKNAI